MTTTFTLRTRSTHPYALVHLYGPRTTFDKVTGKLVPGHVDGIELVGYAASTGPAVAARARRLGARIVPIIDGTITVTL